jgi:hypothetical protein
MRRGLELVKSMQRSLYQQHVLARESAAEFSEVMLSANDDAKSDLQRLLGYLAEANELLPSAISEPSRLGYLTDLLLGTSGNVPDLRTLSSIAHKMVYDSPDMVERLIQVLRDEVDWALLRVARTRARIAV